MCLAVAAAVVIAILHGQRLRPPERPHPFAPEIGLALLVLMLGLGSVGIAVANWLGAIPAVEPGGPSLADDARVRLAAYLGQGIVVVAYVLRTRAARRPDPDARPGQGRAMVIGLVAIVLWWPIVNAAGRIAASIIMWRTGEASPTIGHDTLQMLVDGPGDGWFFLTGAMVVIAAPVTEEILYRGLLQETLRRIGAGPWTAILITSAIFAAMHFSTAAPHAIAGLFVLSIGFGWAFERTGRLAAPILMHALFNLANLAVAIAWH